MQFHNIRISNRSSKAHAKHYWCNLQAVSLQWANTLEALHLNKISPYDSSTALGCSESLSTCLVCFWCWNAVCLIISMETIFSHSKSEYNDVSFARFDVSIINTVWLCAASITRYSSVTMVIIFVDNYCQSPVQFNERCNSTIFDWCFLIVIIHQWVYRQYRNSNNR